MRAQLRVDLNAIRENYRTLSSGLKEGTGKICVVKADAYGHGARETVGILSEADAFAVATVDEAEEILFAEKPVMILGAVEPREMARCAEKGVIFPVWDEFGAAAAIAAAEKAERFAKVAIAVDTGMNRIGVKDKISLYKLIKALKSEKIEVCGIFSHLFDTNSEKTVREQKRRFDEALKDIPYPATRHLAATGGSVYSDMSYDAVRLGIGLYGYGAEGVKPALEAVAKVVRTATLSAGETVGYGGEFVAEKPTAVATVSVGYADGIPRRYTGGEVIIRGKKRKIIGRICMDSCFVEVDEGVRAGDEVVFIGERNGVSLTAEDMAEKLGTIPYEVLVNFKRIKRIYCRS